jgi:hypothetical protein
MVGVYRTLLRLYPAAFRARFAEEMEQLVRDEMTHGGGVRWLGVIGDLLRSSVVQRWDERGKTLRSRVMMGLFFFVIVIGGTMLVTGAILEVSSVIVAMSIFAATALIYGVGTMIGRRGTEDIYADNRGRWWFYPAGLIGAFQLVVGVQQLVQDPKWENVVALAIFGAFAALVFVGIAMRNRRAGNWMIVAGVLPVLPAFWWVVPPIVALVVIVMAIADNVRMGRLRPKPAV